MAGIKPNNFPVRSTLDGTEEIYTQTGGVNEKFTLNEVKEFLSDWTDIIVTGSSAELLSGLIQLLPPPPANKYYEVNKMIFEYTHVTTPYASNNTPLVSGLNNDGFFIDSQLFTSAESMLVLVTNLALSYGASQPIFPANAIISSPVQFVLDLTAGDGTLVVKIRYRILDFGL